MTPAFRCIGGSLMYRQIHLARWEMVEFRDLFREECDCAFKACPVEENGPYEQAVALLKEVTDAIAEHDMWVMAQRGRVS